MSTTMSSPSCPSSPRVAPAAASCPSDCPSRISAGAPMVLDAASRKESLFRASRAAEVATRRVRPTPARSISCRNSSNAAMVRSTAAWDNTPVASTPSPKRVMRMSRVCVDPSGSEIRSRVELVPQSTAATRCLLVMRRGARGTCSWTGSRRSTWTSSFCPSEDGAAARGQSISGAWRRLSNHHRARHDPAPTCHDAPVGISDRLLMGPGPSNPYPSVPMALSGPVLGHLDPQFLEMLDETNDRLREVFATSNALTLPLSGTGSAGMEAAFVNFVRPGDPVVIGVNGVFGERMCDVAARHGADVVRVDAPWGQPLDPATILAAHRAPTIIAVVHAETSTGVRNDVAPLGAAKGDALLVVDMVTSLGGIEVDVDGWGVDVAYSGTQKCLGVPPGLSPFTASPRALERRVETPSSWYLDLGLLANYVNESGGGGRVYHHTAPVSMIAALHAGLGTLLEEGLTSAWARHAECGELLTDGLVKLGTGPARSGRAPPSATDHRPGPRRGRGGSGPPPAPRGLRDRDRGGGGSAGRPGVADRLHGPRGQAPQCVRPARRTRGGARRVSAARALRHAPLELRGKRVVLAPAHRERLPVVARGAHPVRRLAAALGATPQGAPVPSEDRPSFAARCGIRERERHLGTGYGFGIFVGERFAGEVTLSSIQRGPFQSGFIGYWIDEALAGRGLVPEAVVVALRFAFEAISLHRVEISIIPRNHGQSAGGREAGDPRGGRGTSLPRDRRSLGGPRPLRRHRRGVGGAGAAARARMDRGVMVRVRRD